MTLAYETVVTYTALANQLEDNMTHVYSLVSDISAISLPSLQVAITHVCATPIDVVCQRSDSILFNQS